MKPLASLEWWKNRDALFSLVICLNTDLIWQFIFNMLKQDLKASMHGPPIMNPPTLRTSVLSYQVMHDFCWALSHSFQLVSKVQGYMSSKSVYAKSVLTHLVPVMPTGNQQPVLSAFDFLSWRYCFCKHKVIISLWLLHLIWIGWAQPVSLSYCSQCKWHYAEQCCLNLFKPYLLERFSFLLKPHTWVILWPHGGNVMYAMDTYSCFYTDLNKVD